MKYRGPKKSVDSGQLIRGSTENKYKEGALVSERIHTYRKLKVVSYSHRIYYCQILAHPEQMDLAFSEREIMPSR